MDLTGKKIVAQSYRVAVEGTSGDYDLTAEVNINAAGFQSIESGVVKKNDAQVANFSNCGTLNTNFLTDDVSEVAAIVKDFVDSAKKLDSSIISTIK